ncbi:IclR family acetate operon transcriptional repressor [Rhodococcus sp. 27YEA15]|uniref:IclR family transcriptional regulator n=1 Tax=Rhodococcus sp. 27YEA15 TaxID=3156259 RepID=UPI003C79BCE5
MAEPSGSKTLERGLALLDCVAEGASRLDEIAATAGLSRSSAHRMLTTLVTSKYLSIDSEHRYRLGLKLLQLGNKAEASISLSSEVQAVLDELSNATSDASHFGILVGADVLYLAKSRGNRGIEMTSRPGMRLRAQNTAMGKILLSQLADVDAVELFDPTAIRTPNSADTVDRFLHSLESTRANGYSLEDQENELGITCLSVGVPDLTGRIAAAVSVSAPSVHMSAERRAQVVLQLHDAQAQLTRCLPAGFEDKWT